MGIYRPGNQDCKGPIGKIQDEKEITMEQNEKTICVLAVETFGPQSQIDIAIEELGIEIEDQ